MKMDGATAFNISYIFLIIAVAALGLMILLVTGTYFEDVQNGKAERPDLPSQEAGNSAPIRPTRTGMPPCAKGGRPAAGFQYAEQNQSTNHSSNLTL
jgi:hypothetical protein